MNTSDIIKKIPQHVLKNVAILHEAGLEAWLVGGCVRDLIMKREPRDWDITTNATPEQIIALFPKTYYENSYGTVGVVDEGEDIPESLKVIEITPYRTEAGYADKRHPDAVVFSQKLEDDLKRRDFTVNALALDPYKLELIDLYKGQDDIKDMVIRTVGIAQERFTEDALRMLRAVRFSCELNFTIESSTEKAVVDNSHLLKIISRERIRDEFSKIIMSPHPKKGLEMAARLQILKYIVPDLETSIGIDQGGVHVYDVWEHLLRALQLTADKGWPLEIRLAALFHDIGKPATRRKGEKKWTFYGHEVVGAKMTKKFCRI